MLKRFVILASLVLVSSVCLADDENANDPIFDTLEKAKATYSETIEKTKAELVSAFDAQIQEIAKTGILEHVKSLKAEKKEFDADGKLPTSQPMKKAVADYQTDIDNAQKTLDKSYQRAVSDYTKKLQIDKADSVNNEFDAFRKALTAKPASQVNKPADENPGTGKLNEVPLKIPEDATAFKGHHYKYFDDKSTWQVSRAKCEKIGGHLICIGDSDEDSFAIGLIRNAHADEAWIGASDEEQAGIWRWVNGEPFSYTHWGPKQPDNAGNFETCLEINMNYFKVPVWNDYVGGSRLGFVCEWDR